MSEHLLEGYSENTSWWIQNGGFSTYEKAKELSEKDLYKLIKTINSLPDHCIYESPLGHKVFLSHAGTDLNYSKRDLELKGIKEPYLWDRKHFLAQHPVDMFDMYQVHGHTPVEYLYEILCQETKEEVVCYCGGRKYDIDLGAFYTYKTALIDLDTFEIKYFIDESER